MCLFKFYVFFLEENRLFSFQLEDYQINLNSFLVFYNILQYIVFEVEYVFNSFLQYLYKSPIKNSVMKYKHLHDVYFVHMKHLNHCSIMVP